MGAVTFNESRYEFPPAAVNRRLHCFGTAVAKRGTIKVRVYIGYREAIEGDATLERSE